MGLCSRLFNGSAEQTLYATVTPSPEQVEFLQAQWNELAEHLKRELSQQHGYAVTCNNNPTAAIQPASRHQRRLALKQPPVDPAPQ